MGLGTNDVGDRDAGTVVTLLVSMLVEPTMGHAGPSQGKPQDEGETQGGPARPVERNHGPIIAGSVPHALRVLPLVLGESLIAWQERTGYADAMRCMMARLLMLVLGVLSVPSIGLAAMQRPHCAQHSPSAVHQEAHPGMGQQAPEPSPTSWDGATSHDCPHCPATECARVAPCATSSNAAVSVTSLAVDQSVTHRATLRRVQHHLSSTTHQPPTPPPQLIS